MLWHLVAGLALLPAAAGTDVPGAIVVLEAVEPGLPGSVPEAAPIRFALLEDGQLYVGGSSGLDAGRLGSDEVKAIEKRISQVRKLPGLGASVKLGPENKRYRLSIRKGRPLDITATGDTASAPANLRLLASLLADLASFSHASLRPYRPAAYAVAVRERSLVGGCREWTLPMPLADALAAPRTVAPEAVADWPKGAAPASVCMRDKRFVVTLRPLLPGERP